MPLEPIVERQLDGGTGLAHLLPAVALHHGVALQADVVYPSIEGGEGCEEPDNALSEFIKSLNSLALRPEENGVDGGSVEPEGDESAVGKTGIDTDRHSRCVT